MTRKSKNYLITRTHEMEILYNSNLKEVESVTLYINTVVLKYTRILYRRNKRCSSTYRREMPLRISAQFKSSKWRERRTRIDQVILTPSLRETKGCLISPMHIGVAEYPAFSVIHKPRSMNPMIQNKKISPFRGKKDEKIWKKLFCERTRYSKWS